MSLTKEEKEYLESPIDDTALEIIDRLSARCEELEANLNKTAEAHCETQEWWRAEAKKFIDLLSAVEPIVKAAACVETDAQYADEIGIDLTCTAEGITFGMIRHLSIVAAGIRGKG